MSCVLLRSGSTPAAPPCRRRWRRRRHSPGRAVRRTPPRCSTRAQEGYRPRQMWHRRCRPSPPATERERRRPAIEEQQSGEAWESRASDRAQSACEPGSYLLRCVGSEQPSGPKDKDQHQDEEDDYVVPFRAGAVVPLLDPLTDQADQYPPEHGPTNVANAAEYRRREGKEAESEAATVAHTSEIDEIEDRS